MSPAPRHLSSYLRRPITFIKHSCSELLDYNPENLVKRSFKALLERAGLPEIRFHDLRHTCATLLFGRGVHPKHVQELLGHATVAITLDTYSHVLPNMQHSAVAAMEEAFS